MNLCFNVLPYRLTIKSFFILFLKYYKIIKLLILVWLYMIFLRYKSTLLFKRGIKFSIKTTLGRYQQIMQQELNYFDNLLVNEQ